MEPVKHDQSRLHHNYEHIKSMWKQKLIEFCVFVLEKLSDTKAIDNGTVIPRDVMWCLMPLNKHELYQIPPGHRVRPFVILSTEENYVTGFSCSSSLTKCIPKNKQFYLSNQSYNIKKSSYVDTSRVWEIPYDCIKAYYYTLKEEDYNGLILYERTPVVLHNKQMDIGIGTVVKFDQQVYYIYQYQNECYLAHPLYSAKSKRKHTFQVLACQGLLYCLDYRETIQLSEHQNLEKLIQLSQTDIHVINQKKQTALKQRKNMNYVKDLKKEIELNYQIGQCFQTEDGKIFIYLYHRKEKAYGVFLDEYSSGYILRKQHLEYMTLLSTQIEENVIEKILEEIIVNPIDKQVIQHITSLYLRQMEK